MPPHAAALLASATLQGSRPRVDQHGRFASAPRPGILGLACSRRRRRAIDQPLRYTGTPRLLPITNSLGLAPGEYEQRLGPLLAWFRQHARSPARQPASHHLETASAAVLAAQPRLGGPAYLSQPARAPTDKTLSIRRPWPSRAPPPVASHSPSYRLHIIRPSRMRLHATRDNVLYFCKHTTRSVTAALAPSPLDSGVTEASVGVVPQAFGWIGEPRAWGLVLA